MATRWQRVSISIPKRFGPAARRAIADEVIDFIRDRVQRRGLDKENLKMAPYSDSYVKSLDFKIAGKSKNDVNLTLSGDMLGAMDLLTHRPGEIVIGFENGSDENARADGNIRGTYGNDKAIGPKRDFLGLTERDLDRIVNKFQYVDEIASELADRVAREVGSGG